MRWRLLVGKHERRSGTYITSKARIDDREDIERDIGKNDSEPAGGVRRVLLEHVDPMRGVGLSSAPRP